MLLTFRWGPQMCFQTGILNRMGFTFDYLNQNKRRSIHLQSKNFPTKFRRMNTAVRIGSHGRYVKHFFVQTFFKI